MIDAKVLTIGFDAISKKMSENRMHLISIDQQIGDGDLGISMDNGFKAAADMCCANADTADIGKLLFLAGKSFNEAAPSSLGTIISMLLIDAAKQLKGTEVSIFMVVPSTVVSVSLCIVCSMNVSSHSLTSAYLAAVPCSSLRSASSSFIRSLYSLTRDAYSTDPISIRCFALCSASAASCS